MRLLRLLKLYDPHPRMHASAPSEGVRNAVVASISPRRFRREEVGRLARKGALEDDVLHRYLQG